MGLFNKKKDAGQETDSGSDPMPLLGDGTGSPWYAKGAAYKGDPMEASTDRVEATPEPPYEPAYPASDLPDSDHESHS